MTQIRSASSGVHLRLPAGNRH